MKTKSDHYLELQVGIVADKEIPNAGIELPPGSLDREPLKGLGFAWAQPEADVDKGRVVALTERVAARPTGARMCASLASAMRLHDGDVVQLRAPSGGELRRSRKADAVAVYTAIVPAVASLASGLISWTLTGWRFWGLLGCAVATFFAAAYLAWTKWRALNANAR